MKFEFDVGKLKGALLFAAEKDVRYYLKAVYFTRAPSGDGMLAVSTDGHRLTVIYQAQDVSGVPADFGVIVPREALASACKSPLKLPGALFPPAEFTVTGDEPNITIQTAVKVECKRIDAKYPDWRQVIPALDGERTPTAVSVNADYLADYARLKRALSPRAKFAKCHLSTNGAGATVLVGIDEPDVLCVLMPVRGDDEGFERSWLTALKAAAERAAA